MNLLCNCRAVLNDVVLPTQKYYSALLSRYELKVLFNIAFNFLLYIQNGAKIQEELKSKNKKKIQIIIAKLDSTLHSEIIVITPVSYLSRIPSDLRLPLIKTGSAIRLSFALKTGQKLDFPVWLFSDRAAGRGETGTEKKVEKASITSWSAGG